MYDASEYFIRPDIVEALDAYGKDGRTTGDFLKAVLEGDLFGAMMRADVDNAPGIHDICSYIYNELPSACWGTKERVAAWLEKHAARRKQEADARAAADQKIGLAPNASDAQEGGA